MFFGGPDACGALAARKILVPMDGSASAFRSLNMAISIARPIGASVVLVHAMYEPAHSEFRREGSISSAQKAHVRKFMKRAEEAPGGSGIAFRSKTVYGNAGYSILKMAHSRSQGFDLVVICSRGGIRSGRCSSGARQTMSSIRQGFRCRS